MGCGRSRLRCSWVAPWRCAGCWWTVPSWRIGWRRKRTSAARLCRRWRGMCGRSGRRCRRRVRRRWRRIRRRRWRICRIGRRFRCPFRGRRGSRVCLVHRGRLGCRAGMVWMGVRARAAHRARLVRRGLRGLLVLSGRRVSRGRRVPGVSRVRTGRRARTATVSRLRRGIRMRWCVVGMGRRSRLIRRGRVRACWRCGAWFNAGRTRDAGSDVGGVVAAVVSVVSGCGGAGLPRQQPFEGGAAGAGETAMAAGGSACDLPVWGEVVGRW